MGANVLAAGQKGRRPAGSAQGVWQGPTQIQPGSSRIGDERKREGEATF